jgi:hypothetical protein
VREQARAGAVPAGGGRRRVAGGSGGGLGEQRDGALVARARAALDVEARTEALAPRPASAAATRSWAASRQAGGAAS